MSNIDKQVEELLNLVLSLITEPALLRNELVQALFTAKKEEKDLIVKSIQSGKCTVTQDGLICLSDATPQP